MTEIGDRFRIDEENTKQSIIKMLKKEEIQDGQKRAYECLSDSLNESYKDDTWIYYSPTDKWREKLTRELNFDELNLKLPVKKFEYKEEKTQVSDGTQSYVDEDGNIYHRETSHQERHMVVTDIENKPRNVSLFHVSSQGDSNAVKNFRYLEYYNELYRLTAKSWKNKNKVTNIFALPNMAFVLYLISAFWLITVNGVLMSVLGFLAVATPFAIGATALLITLIAIKCNNSYMRFVEPVYFLLPAYIFAIIEYFALTSKNPDFILTSYVWMGLITILVIVGFIVAIRRQKENKRFYQQYIADADAFIKDNGVENYDKCYNYLKKQLKTKPLKDPYAYYYNYKMIKRQDRAKVLPVIAKYQNCSLEKAKVIYNSELPVECNLAKELLKINKSFIIKAVLD